MRWRNSGLYAEFYRPLADVRHQLTIGQCFGDQLVFFAISLSTVKTRLENVFRCPGVATRTAAALRVLKTA